MIDIISFSKLTSRQQQELIVYLTKSYKRMIKRMLSDTGLNINNLFLGFISTGDGFYCILHPNFMGFGTILGLGFNHFSDSISERFPFFKGIRVGVHSGVVYPFTDIMDNTNFVGDGLNDCARLVESKEYKISTVFVSKDAYIQFEDFIKRHNDFERLLQERGFKYSGPYTITDKHGFTKTGYIVWLRQSGIIYPPYSTFDDIFNSSPSSRSSNALYNR